MHATQLQCNNRTNNSFILYKFSAGTKPTLNMNINHLYPDNSDVCISHSIHAKIKELSDKTKIKEKEDPNMEYIVPYHHLASTKDSPSTICKLCLSAFFLELIELVKINYLMNALETEVSPVLFVNATLTESVEFMSVYRNKAFLNVHAMQLHSTKDDPLPPSSRNNMKFIFIDKVGRMDYHEVLNVIHTYQSDEGTLVVKTSDLFYKQSVEFLNILVSMYHHIIFIQPSISSGLSGDRFLVCKNKKRDTMIRQQKMSSSARLLSDDKDVSYGGSGSGSGSWSMYLLNKIEDMNIYFGKRQLENLQNYIEKKTKYNAVNAAALIATLASNNKSKCIQWCNAFQVPCHSLVK